MTDVVLHGAPQSNMVWACRIALAQKGVEARHAPDAPHSPAVNAIHPLGRIPVLTHGDRHVFESRAIVRYIDLAFAGPRLEAVDPAVAAEEEAWTSLILTAADPVIVRRYVFAYLFPRTADGGPDAALLAEMMPDVSKMFAVLERGVADGVLLSDRFRLPDAWAIPILWYVARMPDWPTFAPSGSALAERLPAAAARPAVAATLPPPFPDRQAA